MDELLSRLNNCGVGCYIGKQFMGGMCYADDLTLISPSRRSMNILLKVCEDYANEFHVKFNSSKSLLLTYNVSHDVSFMLDNSVISRVESAVHLGHHVGTNSNTNNINQGNRNLICRTNTMLSRFGFCSSEIRSSLFQKYCTSFYGCPLWDLSSSHINTFFITWRKCIRRVWELPIRTHNRFVNIIQDNVPIDVQLLSSFSTFLINVQESDNPVVSMCSELCKYSDTTVARNRRYLLNYINNNGDILCPNSKNILKHLIRKKVAYDEKDISICTFILEVRHILDGLYALKNFDRDELSKMFLNICTL